METDEAREMRLWNQARLIEEAPQKLCKFYLKGGLCNSLDAPKPGHSRCLGINHCESKRYREESNG